MASVGRGLLWKRGGASGIPLLFSSFFAAPGGDDAVAASLGCASSRGGAEVAQAGRVGRGGLGVALSGSRLLVIGLLITGAGLVLDEAQLILHHSDDVLDPIWNLLSWSVGSGGSEQSTHKWIMSPVLRVLGIGLLVVYEFIVAPWLRNLLAVTFTDSENGRRLEVGLSGVPRTVSQRAYRSAFDALVIRIGIVAGHLIASVIVFFFIGIWMLTAMSIGAGGSSALEGGGEVAMMMDGTWAPLLLVLFAVGAGCIDTVSRLGLELVMSARKDPLAGRSVVVCLAVVSAIGFVSLHWFPRYALTCGEHTHGMYVSIVPAALLLRALLYLRAGIRIRGELLRAPFAPLLLRLPWLRATWASLRGGRKGGSGSGQGRAQADAFEKSFRIPGGGRLLQLLSCCFVIRAWWTLTWLCAEVLGAPLWVVLSLCVLTAFMLVPVYRVLNRPFVIVFFAAAVVCLGLGLAESHAVLAGSHPLKRGVTPWHLSGRGEEGGKWMAPRCPSG